MMARAGDFCDGCGCVWTADENGECVFCAHPEQTEEMLRILNGEPMPGSAAWGILRAHKASARAAAAGVE